MYKATRIMTLTLLAAMLLTACDRAQVERPRPAAPQQTQAPGVEGTAPTPADQRTVMAYVNDQPIYMDRLHDLLVRGHGMPIAQQLIALRILQDEAARRGVTVSPQDVQEEERRIMRQLFPTATDPADARLALEQVREQQGLSAEQWEILVEMNAHQTALAAGEVTVSEEELREAFGARYGLQIQVRHIQLSSLTDAQQALRRLEAGEPFEALAREVSTNISREAGGLLPPFAPDEPTVPLAFRQAAASLNRVGQVSDPVQVMTTYHILRLEAVIEPEAVTLEGVREELEEEIRQARLDRIRQRILVDLVREAQATGRIRFVNPHLRRQYEAQQTETP